MWVKEAEAVGMLLIKEELVSEARRKNMLYMNRRVYVEETQETRLFFFFLPPRLLIVFEFFPWGPFRRRLLRDSAECVHPGARSHSEVPKSLKNVVCWLGRSLEMAGIRFLREIQDSAVFYIYHEMHSA